MSARSEELRALDQQLLDLMNVFAPYREYGFFGNMINPWKGESTTAEVIQKITILVHKGADVNVANEKGVTLLHKAALYSHFAEIAACLLAHGANVDLKDKDGNTPLRWVVSSSDYPLDIIARFINRSRDVNAVHQYAGTPLNEVVHFGRRVEVITLLIAAGAKVNPVDPSCYPALHSSALYWRSSHAQFSDPGFPMACEAVLIANGADLNIKNENGITALESYPENLRPIVLRLREEYLFKKALWDIWDMPDNVDGFEFFLQQLPYELLIDTIALLGGMLSPDLTERVKVQKQSDEIASQVSLNSIYSSSSSAAVSSSSSSSRAISADLNVGLPVASDLNVSSSSTSSNTPVPVDLIAERIPVASPSSSSVVTPISANQNTLLRNRRIISGSEEAVSEDAKQRYLQEFCRFM